jgi:hypothetical protein
VKCPYTCDISNSSAGQTEFRYARRNKLPASEGAIYKVRGIKCSLRKA